jgi:hypothetical protein
MASRPLKTDPDATNEMSPVEAETSLMVLLAALI